MKMKLTKKQKIIAGATAAVILVAGGGTVAVVSHNSAVQAQQAKLTREYDDLKNELEKAMEKANAFEKQEDVDTAVALIQKLKKGDQESYLKQTDELMKLWNAVANATTAVTSAEKSKAEAEINQAQVAIDQLKDKKQESHKLELQKCLDAVKNEVKKAKDEAAAKAEAEKQAQEQGTAVPNGSQNGGGQYSGNTATPSYQAPQGGGQSVAPSNPAPATSGQQSYKPGEGASGYATQEEIDKEAEAANNTDWASKFPGIFNGKKP